MSASLCLSLLPPDCKQVRHNKYTQHGWVYWGPQVATNSGVEYRHETTSDHSKTKNRPRMIYRLVSHMPKRDVLETSCTFFPRCLSNVESRSQHIGYKSSTTPVYNIFGCKKQRSRSTQLWTEPLCPRRAGSIISKQNIEPSKHEVQRFFAKGLFCVEKTPAQWETRWVDGSDIEDRPQSKADKQSLWCILNSGVILQPLRAEKCPTRVFQTANP